MDLLESTLKVVENSTNAQEELNQLKEKLNEFSEYLDQEKNVLEQMLIEKNATAEVVEMHNILKARVNDYLKTSKLLFGLNYNFVNEWEDDLTSLSEGTICLEEVLNEIGEKFKEIERNIADRLKALEKEKLQENSRICRLERDLEQELQQINLQIKQAEQTLNDAEDELYDKEKLAQKAAMNLDILSDNLELETRQIETISTEVKSAEIELMEINNTQCAQQAQLLQLEQTISKLNFEIDHLKNCKIGCEQELERSETILEEIEEKRIDLERQITQSIAEAKKLKIQETEIRKMSIEATKQNLASINTNKIALQTELDEINSKMLEITKELQALTSIESNEVEEKQKTVKLLTEVHNTTVKTLETLTSKLEEIRSDICTKQEELVALKSKQNSEMEDKLKQLTEDLATRKVEGEKEIADIALNNKLLQEKDEQYRKEKEVMVFQTIQEQFQIDDIQKNLTEIDGKLKNVQERIDNVKKEQSTKSAFVKPKAAKRTDSVRQGISQQINKKRRVNLDDSDSSVEGRRISYAEFIAQKRMMESKQQNKNTKEK